MTDQLDQLRNDIKIRSAGSDSFELRAFVEEFASRLEDADVAYDIVSEPLQCRGPRGRVLSLLGYAEDATDASLTIIVGKYFDGEGTVTLGDANDIFGRGADFLQLAADGWLAENLEPSSREAEYADYFRHRLPSVARLRFLLITDGVMSERIRTIPNSIVADRPASYAIWDRNRILAAATPQTGDEAMHIDLTKWLPDGLQCLVAADGGSSTQSYLAVLPGRLLADVFEEYGSQLLESNVRTYLSARGAVNRGIQQTLAHKPEMFLAFNNGLTTTATNVDLVTLRKGTFIRSIENWQIVNGGQTTASLVHFLRGDSKRSVDDVFVQMKLVTVSSENAAEVVADVSKYANSQNRVSGADLFSNHEFHVLMEQTSRRLRAPAREGEQYQTGWYYERSRGQWENDKVARGSAAEQKKFELEYPKSQRLVKTDWAKYAFSWGQRPHTVSKGAQTNFIEYAHQVVAAWEKDANQFGDAYFKNNVAKAILFNDLHKAVRESAWYGKGYLANIVAYGVAKLAHEIPRQFPGSRLNFDAIWARQSTSQTLLSAALVVAERAQEHLTDPRRKQANVTQWAKQEVCWTTFRDASVPLPRDLAVDLIDADTATSQASDDKKQRRMDSGFEAIQRVLKVAPAVWEAVYSSSGDVRLSPMESDLVAGFGLRKGRVPTERQAAALLKALDRMAEGAVISKDAY